MAPPLTICFVAVLLASVAPEPVRARVRAPDTASFVVPSSPIPLEGADEEPTCVAFWPETRYRNYGYDHIVHLRSHCDVQAYCKVWSDVNPHPTDVLVAPRAEVEVLTFRGSPARQFTPHVECRFRV
jgi:hypothetical protein